MMTDGSTPRVRDSAAIAAIRDSRLPLTYLHTEALVRPATSASSFWLIPRSLSRAVSSDSLYRCFSGPSALPFHKLLQYAYPVCRIHPCPSALPFHKRGPSRHRLPGMRPGVPRWGPRCRRRAPPAFLRWFPIFPAFYACGLRCAHFTASSTRKAACLHTRAATFQTVSPIPFVPGGRSWPAGRPGRRTRRGTRRIRWRRAAPRRTARA